MESVNRQLGDFLRQHRERLRPQQVGLQVEGKRRTPGLRREEVAELAGISFDWYVRLEQGRESLPSKMTVEALSKALILNNVEKTHLMRLASGNTDRVFKKEVVPTNLQLLLDGIPYPAYILGIRLDLLYWNKEAVILFPDFEQICGEDCNILRLMFTRPYFRETFIDWENVARGMLEQFRGVYDLWSDSVEFIQLANDLSALSPEFETWWNNHDVRVNNSGEKRMNHPQLGPIKLEYSTFQSNDNPDLRLVLYNRVLSE